jgi:hypothetical protein
MMNPVISRVTARCSNENNKAIYGLLDSENKVYFFKNWMFVNFICSLTNSIVVNFDSDLSTYEENHSDCRSGMSIG